MKLYWQARNPFEVEIISFGTVHRWIGLVKESNLAAKAHPLFICISADRSLYEAARTEI
jgi:hypothetical protein